MVVVSSSLPSLTSPLSHFSSRPKVQMYMQACLHYFLWFRPFRRCHYHPLHYHRHYSSASLLNEVCHRYTFDRTHLYVNRSMRILPWRNTHKHTHTYMYIYRERERESAGNDILTSTPFQRLVGWLVRCRVYKYCDKEYTGAGGGGTTITSRQGCLGDPDRL